ncbi:MAG: hypothetical protein AVDCRST_MAG93-9140 [uncultured Chloroflexia bacterium]|uniref:Uncharacterized protein n=1 Tax=uncultured Chloroflexia bacterium TaxID=1672391 RepID=A0A6J4NEE9_9CHLR|nr:MAG: hypothetical protein AVDCRST_MAG93-9140 [uncultured Chloroflexia bacterium]
MFCTVVNLLKVLVRRQRVSDTTFVHDYKRDTISHTPFLVGSCSKQVQRLEVKVFGQRYNLDAWIGFDRFKQSNSSTAIAWFR